MASLNLASAVRPVAVWRRAAPSALLAALMALGLAACNAPAPADAPAAAAPAAAPEFGGECAMSLAEGRHTATDCSMRWTAPDGKVYCFGDEAARTRFLQDPQGNLERAREFVAASDADVVGKRMEYYKSEDVQAFVQGVIKDRQAANGGAFPFADAVSGQDLVLVYDDVEFVRTLHGYGFFPDVAFHAKDEPAKKYLIDFWIKPEQDKLAVFDTRIYKAPRREGTGWKLATRQPIPWWWIPASEHPGQTEQVRGWEVMSAVEENIVKRRAGPQGLFSLRDDKTGEELKLEFVGTHQPVRRLQQDGRYFACTDFRKQGSKDQYYDVDFWVDEKDGKMKVDDVRVHKVPVQQEDGTWTQVPRYNFDGMKFDVVP